MSHNYSQKSDEQLIKTAYGPKIKISQSFSTQGRTKQSFKAECDINNIMARFLKTGLLDFVQKNEPRYLDTTGFDYQSAQFKVAGAKSMFMELPAALRARFDNEPANFLYFMADERNREEAQQLGLLKPVQAAVAAAAAQPQPTSHREDGSAAHEPLRTAAGEPGAGQYREHTRAERRAEAKAQRAGAGEGEQSERRAKDQ